MHLQNRCMPDGALVATPARGTLMGNRGIIHDGETRQLTRRNWAHKVWIACQTDFNGRSRTVFGKGTYSELFFLDEVTALAAGHRPCFECRRGDALSFRQALEKAFPGESINADWINQRLHRERWLSRREPVEQLSLAEAQSLPSGCVVRQGNAFFASSDGHWLKWDFAGYGEGQDIAGDQTIELVTPRTIIAALDTGYEPKWHASAGV